MDILTIRGLPLGDLREQTSGLRKPKTRVILSLNGCIFYPFVTASEYNWIPAFAGMTIPRRTTRISTNG